VWRGDAAWRQDGEQRGGVGLGGGAVHGLTNRARNSFGPCVGEGSGDPRLPHSSFASEEGHLRKEKKPIPRERSWALSISRGTPAEKGPAVILPVRAGEK